MERGVVEAKQPALLALVYEARTKLSLVEESKSNQEDRDLLPDGTCKPRILPLIPDQNQLDLGSSQSPGYELEFLHHISGQLQR